MADDWSLTQYQPKGTAEQWFFRKNLRPAIAPGAPEYRHVVYLTFHFRPRDESGLPDPADTQRLYELEETDIPALEQDGLAVYVAAVMKPGIKDVLFYTRDPQLFLDQALPLRSRHQEIRVSCEIIEDPAWEHYADFPGGE